jgi:hypothetical protein
MPWFDRHVADGDDDAALAALDRAVGRSRLVEALGAASGPYGLRRFGVRFELRGGRARIAGLETAPLPRGGGPPASSTFDANARALEGALDALHRSIPAPFGFDRGVAGFVRDADGRPTLSLRFDEDADAFRLSELPMPRGEPHPLEDPAYARALAAWDSRIAPLRARWTVARDDWSLTSGVLASDGVRTRAVPLAIWSDGRFAWRVESPVAEEAPFVEPELVVPLADAGTLALFAATRLGCVGLFQGTLEGAEGAGGVLFAGLRE